MNKNPDCFTRFKKNIADHALPNRFTYPFFYEPHSLCLLAAEELQQHLLNQKEWSHDFGINHFVDGVNVGKMFGILLVENQDGEIGFLSAFSGKLGGKAIWPKFVPPIVDYLDEDSFYRKGEKEIMNLSILSKQLEQDQTYIDCKERLHEATTTAEKEINEQKYCNKEAKASRAKLRKEKLNGLDSDLQTQLSEQSKQDHFLLKDLNRKWQQVLNLQQNKLHVYSNKIDAIKKERRLKSAALQQSLFDRYQFLNYKGEKRDLCDIFAETPLKTPPSGAGDCCAPKLLQYAYQNQFKPLALAEFWWGQSPKSEIRKHGYFYPSCKGKCYPILGHMLKGLEVDSSPMLTVETKTKTLTVLFEDSYMLVLVKPNDFLSVPGKSNADSVLARMQKKYPKATGPIIVHRLDRATSGIMLIAKTKEAHQSLQEQFRIRTIEKTYVAVLEGSLSNQQGVINLPIRPDIDDRPRQLVCHEHGKKAITHWVVLKKTDIRTKVMFRPITGRTHQLRVHAAHQQGLNTPIVGDDLYGKTDKRLHLHAQSISFVHPVSGESMEFTTEAPF